ncbi:MAG: HigA family addiction module antitoxin [Hyphomicrobiales bacterium]
MTVKLRNPVHPGEILARDFLEANDLTAEELADATLVPVQNVEDIVSSSAQVTAGFALRLSAFFGTSPEFWLNLQRDYDLAKASCDESLK